MNIELRHLKTLMALDQTGSLVEAAAQIHLTQSALSHQLKELEGRLDQPLFYRKTKPVRFTPAGQRLLELAQSVLPQIEASERDLSRIRQGRKGRLNITIECHSCYDWLMPTLNEFRGHWPEVELDMLGGFHFDSIAKLKNGELDLVVTSDPKNDENVQYLPLFKYQAMLVLAPDHALTQKPVIEPHDLSKETLITYPVDCSSLDVFQCFLTPAGIEPGSVRQVELTMMMVQLVASGRGISCLPNWAVHDYVKQGFVVDKPLGRHGVWRTLYAAVRAEQAENAFIQDFKNIAQRVCHQHLEGIKHA
ncbi:LysR family transcriptional regulator [Bermanella sp. WJH001]|uniref:LysR family transcriptional regulator n=1 Tax=Bermanella sp. WJH001 TaxID=3048005 RepID=UPI0024BEB88E|nr:LysR family transcriptional regulator [Bermanella sp. WJH001]MDJ1536832.1 LysR family transcriptional regulator [Bermanella sp. WJH001]